MYLITTGLKDGIFELKSFLSNFGDQFGDGNLRSSVYVVANLKVVRTILLAHFSNFIT